MLEEAVAGAAQIADRITSEKHGKKWRVSQKEASAIYKDKKMTTNDLTVLRRAIPFVSKTPIVREKESDSHSRNYIALSEEEFNNYKFTDKNFYKLPMEDIVKIRKRILDEYPDTSQIELLRLLTICDYAIKIGAEKQYVKLPKRILAMSVGLKDSKELSKRVHLLVKCGIFVALGESLQYNKYFNDVDKSSPEIEIHKRTKKEDQNRKESLQLAKKHMEEVSKYIDSLVLENDELYQKTVELKYENIKMTNAYKEERRKNSAYPAIVESYQKLREDNDKKSEELEKVGLVVSDINGYRKEVEESVKSTLASFTQKMLKVTMEYQKNHKDDEMLMNVNTLIADTVSSVQNILKTAGKKKWRRQLD